jgi:aminodeoxyfutalosine synthase
VNSSMETLALDRLTEKVDAGTPLSADEAQQLAATNDIIALGMLADRVRRRKHGNAVTYVRVAEVSLDQAVNGQASWPVAAREIRLVGQPQSFEEARAAVRAVAVAAGVVPLTGLSLSALEALANGDSAELARQLALLRDEGLTRIAEACVDDIGDIRSTLAAANDARLPVSCFTVGRISREGLAAFLGRVAEALTAAPSTVSFAPLPRREGPEPTTGYEDVRAVAIARILLAVEHIQVDWRLHGPKLAQVALTFGADDVHNVASDDDLSEGYRRSPREEIIRNIRAAGFVPAERDGRFVLLD